MHSIAEMVLHPVEVFAHILSRVLRAWCYVAGSAFRQGDPQFRRMRPRCGKASGAETGYCEAKACCQKLKAAERVVKDVCNVQVLHKITGGIARSMNAEDIGYDMQYYAIVFQHFAC